MHCLNSVSMYMLRPHIYFQNKQNSYFKIEYGDCFPIIILGYEIQGKIPRTKKLRDYSGIKKNCDYYFQLDQKIKHKSIISAVFLNIKYVLKQEIVYLMLFKAILCSLYNYSLYERSMVVGFHVQVMTRSYFQSTSFRYNLCTNKFTYFRCLGVKMYTCIHPTTSIPHIYI